MAFYFFAFCLQHWHETTNKHTNDTHCTGQAFRECVFVVVACAAIPAPSETHVLKLQWGSVCLETIDELCLRQIFHHHFSCLSLVSVYNCHPSPVNHVQSVRTNIKMMCVRVLWRFRMATFLFPSYSSRWFTVFFFLLISAVPVMLLLFDIHGKWLMLYALELWKHILLVTKNCVYAP